MKNIVTILMFLGVATLSFAQSNPSIVRDNIKHNNQHTYTLFSLGQTPTSISVSGVSTDKLEFAPIDGQPNQYEMEVITTSGQFGDLVIDVEYYAIGDIPGIPYPFYTQYILSVYPSEVNVQDDVVIVNEGDVITLNPLSNDSADSELQLTDIAYSNSCTSTVVDNQTLEIIVDNSIQSLGYVRYVVEDEVGTSAAGNVVLVPVSMVSDLSLQLHNKEQKDIFVPTGFTPDSPANGTIAEVQAHCYRYDPNDDFTGTETLVFSDGLESINVTLEVSSKELEIQFVKDDEFYTVPTEPIQFNVLENDFLDILPIVDYSSELEYLGNGEFTYTSSNMNFIGDKVFYYKVFNGFTFLEASIVIHVSHYSPNEPQIDYVFNVDSNKEYAFTHQSPYQDYTISVVTQPAHGSVNIVQSDYSNECSTATQTTVVYNANGYVGSDIFELRYCSYDDYCEIVKVDVNATDNNLEDDCQCLSDCLWEGDVNNDGIVNTLDMLQVAQAVGKAGLERDQIADTWTSVNNEPWNYNQINGEYDLSYCDVNGDGLIDIDDLQTIEDNYGKIHDLVSKPKLNLLNLPINLIPSHSPDIDSGELLIFYIEIGNADYPVLDFSGLSFNFAFDSTVVDSSSLYIKFYDDGWSGYGSPYYTYSNQIHTGNVDVAVSKVGGSSSTGYGIMAEVGFIVEDDICGLRLDDNQYQFPVSMTDIVLLTSEGKQYSLPNKYTSSLLNIDRQEDTVNDNISIVFGPNPTSNRLYITSNQVLDGNVTIYNINGQSMLQTAISSMSNEINVANLTSGTYIVKYASEHTSITEKILKL